MLLDMKADRKALTIAITNSSVATAVMVLFFNARECCSDIKCVSVIVTHGSLIKIMWAGVSSTRCVKVSEQLLANLRLRVCISEWVCVRCRKWALTWWVLWGGEGRHGVGQVEVGCDAELTLDGGRIRRGGRAKWLLPSFFLNARKIGVNQSI